MLGQGEGYTLWRVMGRGCFVLGMGFFSRLMLLQAGECLSWEPSWRWALPLGEHSAIGAASALQATPAPAPWPTSCWRRSYEEML